MDFPAEDFQKHRLHKAISLAYTSDTPIKTSPKDVLYFKDMKNARNE